MKILMNSILLMLLIPLAGAVVNLQKTGGFSATQFPYLYDDGTTVFFNETRMNETITSLVSGASGGNSSSEMIAATQNIYVNRTGDTMTGRLIIANHSLMFTDGEYINASIFGTIKIYADNDIQLLADGEVLVDSDMTPATNLARSLGSDTLLWKYVYSKHFIADGDMNASIFNGDWNGSINAELLINDSYIWQSIHNGFPPYLYNDTSFNYFNETRMNETIEALLVSTTFKPDNVTYYSGTHDTGNITSIQFAKDKDYYNMTEGSGASPLTLQINFSDVTDFNSILFRLRYKGGSGHEIAIGLWDYDENDYEEEYGSITDMDDYAFFSVNVYDASSHIDNGIVSLQLRHIEIGNTQHWLSIDYAVLIDGFNTITNTVHDSMTERDLFDTNHPLYASWIKTINGSIGNQVDQNVNKSADNVTFNDLNITSQILIGTPSIFVENSIYQNLSTPRFILGDDDVILYAFEDDYGVTWATTSPRMSFSAPYTGDMIFTGGKVYFNSPLYILGGGLGRGFILQTEIGATWNMSNIEGDADFHFQDGTTEIYSIAAFTYDFTWVGGDYHITTSDFYVDTSDLYVDISDNVVGINTNTPNTDVALDVVGKINATDDIITSGNVCGASGCLDSITGGGGNTTDDMIRAVNYSGLLVNYSTWIYDNTTDDMIRAVNYSGLVINYTSIIIPNTTNQMISAVNYSGLLINYSSVIIANTTEQMRVAINDSTYIYHFNLTDSFQAPVRNITFIQGNALLVKAGDYAFEALGFAGTGLKFDGGNDAGYEFHGINYAGAKVKVRTTGHLIVTEDVNATNFFGQVVWMTTNGADGDTVCPAADGIPTAQYAYTCIDCITLAGASSTCGTTALLNCACRVSHGTVI